MRDFDWLCETLLQLDGFAAENGLVRFRIAISNAADLAVMDVSEIKKTSGASGLRIVQRQD